MPHINGPKSNPFLNPAQPFSFPKAPPLLAKREPAPKPTPRLPSEAALSFGSIQGKAQTSVSLTEEPQFKEVTVKRGDSLGKIAKRELGDFNKYMELFELNKDQMGNPNDLRIGMKIKVPVDNSAPNKVEFPTGTPVAPDVMDTAPTQPKPPQTEDAPTVGKPNPPAAEPAQPEFKEVKVGRGDSLSVLAFQHLGDSERYMEIYNANKDQLKSPDAVRVGMTLKIPTSDRKPSNAADPGQVTGNVPIDAAGMNADAKELYQALKNYQAHHRAAGNPGRARTSDAELREIAVETAAAGKAFGVDPKLMLSVFAHESGGFDPRAKSHTGAGGLGQLTGIAIKQVHYMAGMAKGQKGRSPYTGYKDNFVQSQRQTSARFNIKRNIWTSTAYMAYEIKDRNNGNLKRAIERYGDPNVSTYENKVNKEFKTLFGGSLF